jgi:hypothetical protein
MKASFRLRGCGWLLLLVLLCGNLAVASDWSGPATELAKSIAGASGPGTITLSIGNSSSLPKDQVPEIQRTLEAQLRTSGVRVGAVANANSEVRVTLSENLRSYVWVAEIRQGSDTHVAMVTIPRPQSATVPRNAATVSVRKALLWTQSSEILDLMLLDASTPNPKMVVLDPDSIAIYSLHEGRWQREQNLAIAHSRIFPRDLRGLLFAGKDRAIEAYLPGTVCDAASPTAGALICRESDDAWKLGPRAAFFNSGRNYFTGALVPASDKTFDPFYSMAWLDKQNYLLSISTAVDGRVRISDGVNERVLSAAATSDWGSDIVAVKSSCGAGSQLLVSSAVDDTATDSIRAYEIPDRDPVLASTPTDFPGPITALWSHDPTSATAVVHNLQTGQYEGYSVSITCY